MNEADGTGGKDALVQDVLDQLTRDRGRAVFSRGDIETVLEQGADSALRDLTAADVVRHAKVLALHDPEVEDDPGRDILADGRDTDLFTSAALHAQEQAMLETTDALAALRRPAPPAAVVARVADAYTLTDEQQDVLRHASRPEKLALISGRAGTGKTHVAAAIREVHAQHAVLAGQTRQRIWGIAPTHTVAENFAGAGFANRSTMHGFLRERLGGNDVVVIDEFAAADTDIQARVLEKIRKAGAKAIVIGDERQMPPVGAGGMFPELVKRHGAARLTEVRRQQVPWQREMVQDLGSVPDAELPDAFRRAFETLAAHERVRCFNDGTHEQNQDEALDALHADWAASERDAPQASRIAVAYTNTAVDRLNERLHGSFVARSGLEGAGVRVPVATRDGDTADIHLVEGSRIQFDHSVPNRGIFNGSFGRIAGLRPVTKQRPVTTIDERGVPQQRMQDYDAVRITAVMDGTGKSVTWDSDDFDRYRHGYATTVHKVQGATVDRAFVVMDPRHERAETAYVGLSRARHDLKVYVLDRSLSALPDFGAHLGEAALDAPGARAAASAYRLREAWPRQPAPLERAPPDRPAAAREAGTARATGAAQTDPRATANHRELAMADDDEMRMQTRSPAVAVGVLPTPRAAWRSAPVPEGAPTIAQGYAVAEQLEILKQQVDQAAAVRSRFARMSADAPASIVVARAAYENPGRSGFTIDMALDRHVESLAKQNGVDGPEKGRLALDVAAAVHEASRRGEAARSRPGQQGRPADGDADEPTLAGIASYLNRMSRDLAPEDQARRRSMLSQVEGRLVGLGGPGAELEHKGARARDPETRLLERSHNAGRYLNGDHLRTLEGQARELNRSRAAVGPLTTGRKIRRLFSTPDHHKLSADALRAPGATPLSFGIHMRAFINEERERLSKRRSRTSLSYSVDGEYRNGKQWKDFHTAHHNFVSHALQQANGDPRLLQLIHQTIANDPEVRQVVGGREDFRRAVADADAARPEGREALPTRDPNEMLAMWRNDLGRRLGATRAWTTDIARQQGKALATDADDHRRQKEGLHALREENDPAIRRDYAAIRAVLEQDEAELLERAEREARLMGLDHARRIDGIALPSMPKAAEQSRERPVHAVTFKNDKGDTVTLRAGDKIRFTEQCEPANALPDDLGVIKAFDRGTGEVILGDAETEGRFKYNDFHGYTVETHERDAERESVAPVQRENGQQESVTRETPEPVARGDATAREVVATSADAVTLRDAEDGRQSTLRVGDTVHFTAECSSADRGNGDTAVVKAFDHEHGVAILRDPDDVDRPVDPDHEAEDRIDYRGFRNYTVQPRERETAREDAAPVQQENRQQENRQQENRQQERETPEPVARGDEPAREVVARSADAVTLRDAGGGDTTLRIGDTVHFTAECSSADRGNGDTAVVKAFDHEHGVAILRDPDDVDRPVEADHEAEERVDYRSFRDYTVQSREREAPVRDAVESKPVKSVVDEQHDEEPARERVARERDVSPAPSVERESVTRETPEPAARNDKPVREVVEKSADAVTLRDVDGGKQSTLRIGDTVHFTAECSSADRGDGDTAVVKAFDHEHGVAILRDPDDVDRPVEADHEAEERIDYRSFRDYTVQSRERAAERENVAPVQHEGETPEPAARSDEPVREVVQKSADAVTLRDAGGETTLRVGDTVRFTAECSSADRGDGDTAVVKAFDHEHGVAILRDPGDLDRPVDPDHEAEDRIDYRSFRDYTVPPREREAAREPERQETDSASNVVPLAEARRSRVSNDDARQALMDKSPARERSRVR